MTISETSKETCDEQPKKRIKVDINLNNLSSKVEGSDDFMSLKPKGVKRDLSPSQHSALKNQLSKAAKSQTPQRSLSKDKRFLTSKLNASTSSALPHEKKRP